MRYLVTGKEMKLLDQNTSGRFHVPELVLMEQAAIVFVQELFSLEKTKGREWTHALILCGNGNNGADGLAIARLLTQRGRRVTVLACGEGNMTESCRIQREICEAYGIPIRPEISQFSKYDLVIDAIFGIGLSRGIEGKAAGVLELANNADAWRVAVDISSGVCADNGAVPAVAFRADDTVTFSFGKLGQFLWPGNEYSGRVHIVPMGITEESFGERRPGVVVLEEADLMLPARRAHSNKGSYGKLLVIAGAAGMAGAACLCAKAAYRSGCGLVRVLTAEENRIVLQTAVPEAILTTWSGDIEQTVADAVRWADAVVLGPGIGTDDMARRLVELVLRQVRVPLLLDADALNILACDMSPLRKRNRESEVVVTPHLGEMSRLTGQSVVYLQEHLCEAAGAFAGEFGVTCVLKDFHTVTAIPGKMTYLNLSGNPGMATAGSGDVLAGIIGSLLAQGMRSMAAPVGVYLHGLAGDVAAEEIGMRAMMAGDIVEGLAGIDPTGGR